MSKHQADSPVLLTRFEVSLKMRVNPMTVGEWARRGKLRSIRTPGNQRRFSEADVDRIASGEDPAEVYRTSALAHLAGGVA